ncbi:MAG: amidase [Rhodospirillales bacterium]
MSAVTEMDLAELSAAIQDKSLSPVEIAEAFLARIEALNPSLNAFVTVTAERALAQARAAEAEILAGKRRGALQGLPIAHKDLYATAGVRTTGGSKILEDWTPDQDATVVRLLDEAGMVMLGKLNTHEFAYGPTGEHSAFGPSRNPWDTSRITAGSSGGSGGAVAGGLAPVASGSDTGGSIRMPAACCGLTGLKPTYGRVSRAGILSLCWSMDHAGPLTRSARDAAMILEAIAGPDPRDAASADRPVPAYGKALTGRIEGLKIGLPRRYFYHRTQAPIVGAVEEALKVLEGLGAELLEVEIPWIDQAQAAAMPIYLAEATAFHEDWLGESPELYSEQVRGFLELGEHLLAKDYLHAQRYRSLLGQGMAEVLAEVDVLATPGLAITATPIGSETVEVRGTEEGVFGALLRNTEPFDLTGLPAVVVPCGFVEGLPISLQIAGRAFDEETVLRVADAYQRTTDWHRRRPAL